MVQNNQINPTFPLLRRSTDPEKGFSFHLTRFGPKNPNTKGLGSRIAMELLNERLNKDLFLTILNPQYDVFQSFNPASTTSVLMHLRSESTEGHVLKNKFLKTSTRFLSNTQLGRRSNSNPSLQLSCKNQLEKNVSRDIRAMVSHQKQFTKFFRRHKSILVVEEDNFELKR